VNHTHSSMWCNFIIHMNAVSFRLVSIV